MFDIKEIAQRKIDERNTRIALIKIREYIKPFRSGMMKVWVDENRLIYIALESFPGAVAKIQLDKLVTMLNPIDSYVEIGIEAGKYFQSLMNESVPDNIILGEQ